MAGGAAAAAISRGLVIYRLTSRLFTIYKSQIELVFETNILPVAILHECVCRQVRL